jgi:precorrin-2 dehydrogenase
MIPIVLDPARLRLGLAGRGPAFRRRLDALLLGRADPILFTDDPAAAPGRATSPLPPDDVDLAALDVLWVAGLPDDDAAAMATAARAARVLVNVEDRRAVCDFHSAAEVRRGDLLIALSTAGRSPGLAGRIRTDLAGRYGPEWAERLDGLASRRSAWRHEGADVATLARRTNAAIDAAGWFA